jgi:hypothetical protein
VSHVVVLPSSGVNDGKAGLKLLHDISVVRRVFACTTHHAVYSLRFALAIYHEVHLEVSHTSRGILQRRSTAHTVDV